MTRFTFIDIEAVWDERLHEAYRQIDPGGAGELTRNGHHRKRLPCKRIIAAAAFDIDHHDTGAVSIDGLRSWTQHEHGDEREVVIGLFDHLRGHPDRHVVTYSGLATEIPLLTLAAIEHDLVLPEQLRTGPHLSGKVSSWRPHIDLALELKGKGRDWAHLTEIGLRFGLPSALFEGKAEFAMPQTSEEWLAMRQRVSMDCVLTAMVALALWRANGRIRLDQAAMLHHIASWCLRTGVTSGDQAEALGKLRQHTLERIFDQVEGAA